MCTPKAASASTAASGEGADDSVAVAVDGVRDDVAADVAAALGGDEDFDWLKEAIEGCSLRRVDLQSSTNGWASPPGDLFNLRASGYLSGRRIKAPGGEWLLLPAGVDWLRSGARLDHVLARPDNRVAAAFSRARRRSKSGRPAVLLAVNIQVPARPEAYSAVFYFAAEEPIPPESLLGRFIDGDDTFRSGRLKMVNRIVKGPWIVRAAVGNYGACLLGRALPCRFHRGDGYLEIDVDIGSSAIATAVLNLALGSVRSVAIDMGFAVEPQTEEELPERLFGAVRISHIEMGSAVYVPPIDTTPALAAQPSSPSARGTLNSRSSARVAHHNSFKERSSPARTRRTVSAKDLGKEPKQEGT